MIVNRNDINQTEALLKTGRAIDHGEISELCNLLRRGRPNPIVADVGANFGTYSLAFARAVGSEGRVHAFEAQRIIFNMLCGTVALNALTNVFCHHLAVGDRDGMLDIPQYDYFKPLNFGSVEFGDRQIERLEQPRGNDLQRREKVPLVALDSFGWDRLDLLKIDVEGMEFEALRGAEETIRRCRPILYVEYIKVDPRQLGELIESYDYRVMHNAMNYLALPLDQPEIRSAHIG
jgi:FkbM family methyltransferase